MLRLRLRPALPRKAEPAERQATVNKGSGEPLLGASLDIDAVVQTEQPEGKTQFSAVWQERSTSLRDFKNAPDAMASESSSHRRNLAIFISCLTRRRLREEFCSKARRLANEKALGSKESWRASASCQLSERMILLFETWSLPLFLQRALAVCVVAHQVAVCCSML